MTFPKTPLSDKSLSSIAQSAIGRNWELLGPELGINQALIDHIKADNNSEEMRIYTLLLKWKKSVEHSGGSATLDCLADVLQSCPTVYVEWDVMRKITDELQENASLERPDLKSDNDHTAQGDETEWRGQTSDDLKQVEFILGLKNQRVERKPCTGNFDCKVNMATKVQWYFNNRHMSSTSKHNIVDKGHIHRLIVEDVCDRDEGKYCVIAEGQKSEGSLIVEDTEEEKALLRMVQREMRLKSQTREDTKMKKELHSTEQKIKRSLKDTKMKKELHSTEQKIKRSLKDTKMKKELHSTEQKIKRFLKDRQILLNEAQNAQERLIEEGLLALRSKVKDTKMKKELHSTEQKKKRSLKDRQMLLNEAQNAQERLIEEGLLALRSDVNDFLP